MTHHENLIAGTWVSGTDLSENINPSDLSDSIGHYARADASQVDDAVFAARDALPKWAHASPQMRADLLDAVGIAILAQKDDIGRMLAREEGKTLAEAVGETIRSAQIFRFFAGEAMNPNGKTIAVHGASESAYTAVAAMTT